MYVAKTDFPPRKGPIGRIQMHAANVKPQYFFIITRKGALGLGEFPFHKWHKREKENILKAVGIKVEYGDPLHEGEYRGTFRTVSDKEHAEMIRLYIEEELSLEKIAEYFKRSSRTPLLHIRKHNRAVERSEFCPACRRIKSIYESEILQKNVSKAASNTRARAQ